MLTKLLLSRFCSDNSAGDVAETLGHTLVFTDLLVLEFPIIIFLEMELTGRLDEVSGSIE